MNGIVYVTRVQLKSLCGLYTVTHNAIQYEKHSIANYCRLQKYVYQFGETKEKKYNVQVTIIVNVQLFRGWPWQ